MIAPLLVAAALATGPVPLLDAPAARDVAIAGDQVIVSRQAPRGGVRVDALPIAGGPARRLLDARVPGWRRTALAFVSASPQRVAVIAWYSKGHGHLPAIRFQQRVYTGPPSGPLRPVAREGKWQPVDIAVGDDRVAVLERETRLERSRARVLLPDGSWQTVPWHGAYMFPPIALAGDRVAFIVPSRQRLVVLNLATGVRELSLAEDGAPGIDLAADGHVVFSGGEHDLFTAPPRRRLPGSRDLFRPRLAGTAVAALERLDNDAALATRPAVLDPGATAPRPMGVPSYDLRALDADARGLAWIANGCVLYAPLDAAAPAEPPAGPCPRAEAFVSRFGSTLRGRKLWFEVSCVTAPASGCTGTTTLRLRHRGIAGRRAFHVEPGARQAFVVRLTRAAARFVRRRVRSGHNVVLRPRTRISDGRVSSQYGAVVVGRVT